MSKHDTRASREGLWHSIRQGDPWSQFADVEGEAGERGRFVKVSCAFQYNDNIPPETQRLHVCAITDDGRLWYSLRRGNPWRRFRDVEAAAGGRGVFSKVACNCNGTHVCGITVEP
jgi:uncharacterized protein YigE (DUF2233 family)